ncbi:sulfatase-like hydrolase/transferase [Parahaliea mediterranea]|uniref:Sulfatase-like hydrolase/transferase n=1 Tax=Parahaliea mediterranea TaxID=651086 RepID=A0A939DCA8_9GAMM|nr:sulfatase-like hydrolase/transferase [Parahaliea mediterranea]MBN7795281.1 sulfatase-like hydrolase/transferase [Parahaliea mediterranea]
MLALVTLPPKGWSSAEVTEPPERPNILVILTDDMGYGDLGVYGAIRIRTPNIDSLARRGMRFTQGYASANVCSPSRAGLMTGRYAIRSGLAWKVLESDSVHGMPASEETLAELAGRAGYSTMLVGKWHLGHEAEHWPLRHGFQSFYGVPFSNDMSNFALYEGEQRLEYPVRQETLTARYTQRAVQFIRRRQGQPFLLVVSHTFPHIPLYASDTFQGSSDAGTYGDTVQEIDWSTGELLKALRETGALDNTLVIFTSDNGPFFEGATAQLRDRKGSTWEGGIASRLLRFGRAIFVRDSSPIVWFQTWMCCPLLPRCWGSSLRRR